MRSFLAVLAFVLLVLPVPGALADDDVRIVAYCDAGACPGASLGDRTDDCNYLINGYLGTCAYVRGVPPLSGGVGAGVIIGPGLQHGFCFDIEFCAGASLESNADCLGGQQVRVFSHYGQVNQAVCLRGGPTGGPGGGPFLEIKDLLP